ncbi:MogA/MoaB family molybdenum cofactor biosynthesis protein [Halosegnis longus]|uniref:MogA/MoaB family molybdenum cofactor biosynthesis protein n=1 Tax=Halosegnis longus TaxID=2216012 RepID=A0AAJ4UVG4_9EURY|nr:MULTISPECIES: MogA/MoaB family molybdenum cofactor biosynthesis protein [Halobacteriales]RNJ25973.1 MogA/MoaB family molybdenum cofactor biosynthesis protein [Salella cibi]
MTEGNADEGGDHHEHEHHEGHEHGDHDHHHDDIETLGVSVVTISSTRSLDEDPSGDTVASACTDAGHEVVHRELVPDDHDRIQAIVGQLSKRDDTDTVITTGGTGVSPDDVTVEAVERLFAKRLPGFGELFRRLSYEEVGTRVVGTRATAGIVEGVPVFCLPGSNTAARLGVREVVLPEAPHLAGLARHEDDPVEEGDATEDTESGDEDAK